MPIGADGETFVPITTFTGAPHGTLHHNQDGDNTLREYNGVGSRFITQTKSTVSTSLQAGSGSYYWNTGSKRFDYMTLKGKAMDYALRSPSRFNVGGLGLVKVNGELCTFQELHVHYGSIQFEADECYLKGVKPLSEPDKFIKDFFDGAINTFANEVVGIEVEFLFPLMDNEAILFFGGGHTGLTFDISDGTDNDYTDHYKHPLAKGPTGFAGFQNLGEISAPTAILDFTDVLNEDTINDDTSRGSITEPSLIQTISQKETQHFTHV